MLNSISSVTISRSVDRSLVDTLISLNPYVQCIDSIVVVVSSASDRDLSLLRESLDFGPRLKVFANSDKSLYHAMNIALASIDTSYVFFLNAGDFLSNGIPFEHIRSQLRGQLVVMLSLIVDQTFQRSWLRSPYLVSDADNLLRLVKLPAHCSCLFPLESYTKDRIYYDELKPVSADSFFISASANRYGVAFLPYVFGIFVLGGVSSSPSFMSAKSNFRSKRYARAMLYFFLSLFPFCSEFLLNKIRSFRGGLTPLFFLNKNDSTNRLF